jgi:hypothetical protein
VFRAHVAQRLVEPLDDREELACVDIGGCGR